MIRDFLFFTTEALISIRRSGIMMFISIATITVSLIVFGIFLLLSANISNLTTYFAAKLEIRAYLKDSTRPDEILDLKTRFEAIPSVRKVEFIDKNTAWEEFKKNYPKIELNTLISDNPLPNAFRIILSDSAKLTTVANHLKGFESVEDVGDMGAIADRITAFSEYTRIAGIILVSLLTFATLLIIVNTIRLTVIARQDEITIMQLVGATTSFIRWPFIIEGLIIGVIGSVFSIVFLIFGYSFFVMRFQEKIPFFPLVYSHFTLNIIYLGIFIVGTTLGVLGAYLSVSRTIKSNY
ncbi:ABC transporter permease [bacterium]|nr:ABC transporter permease [bacterium]